MLFNAVVQSTTSEMFTISGNSWSNCLSYLEGTGKTIKTITLQNNNVIPNIPNQGYCYNVSIKNETTNEVINTEIFDTYEYVLGWINSQTGYSLQGIILFNKTFVSI
jgi:hypothetical protein